MKKILSVFCLLCLFAAPLALTACEASQEEELEGGTEIETTFEEGAVEVDETMDMGTGMDMGTDMDMGTGTDMDMGTEMEPPVE
ncbi:MAG TPA: hypothetical protein VHM02_12740 [Thermoanaerobaculia bacterium]|nr:hypothetical protein [Thermoanaerobaculia bacterium]